MRASSANILIKQLVIVFFFCLFLTFVGFSLAVNFSDFLSSKHTTRYLARMESHIDELWQESMIGITDQDYSTDLAKRSLEKFGLSLMKFPGVGRVDLYGSKQEKLWSTSKDTYDPSGLDLSAEKFIIRGIDLKQGQLFMHVPVGELGGPSAVAILVYSSDVGEFVSLISSKTFLALMALMLFGVLSLYAIFNRLNRPYREQNQELVSILSTTPQGIVTFDDKLIINSANQRFLDFCSAKGSVIGWKLIDICQLISDPGNFVKLKKAMRSGNGSGEFSVIARKKELAYRWQVIAMRDDAIDGSDEKRFMMLLDDVTENKQLWERLGVRQYELEKKNEFLAIVLHQIRSPLADVRWLAEALGDEDLGRLNKEQKSSIKSIEASVKRLSETISGLTTLFGIEGESLKAVKNKRGDVVQVVRDVLADLQASIKTKEIEVEVVVPSRVPLVGLDSALLRQVVLNYVTNAIRYSYQGGKVEIKLSVDRQSVNFHIADHGIGVPKHEQGKIFARFYRASNAIKVAPDGTGLGLALVKSIMKFCGGSYGFSSKENKGSIFYAKFPISGQRSNI